MALFLAVVGRGARARALTAPRRARRRATTRPAACSPSSSRTASTSATARSRSTSRIARAPGAAPRLRAGARQVHDLRRDDPRQGRRLRGGRRRAGPSPADHFRDAPVAAGYGGARGDHGVPRAARRRGARRALPQAVPGEDVPGSAAPQSRHRRGERRDGVVGVAGGRRAAGDHPGRGARARIVHARVGARGGVGW